MTVLRADVEVFLGPSFSFLSFSDSAPVFLCLLVLRGCSVVRPPALVLRPCFVAKLATFLTFDSKKVFSISIKYVLKKVLYSLASLLFPLISVPSLSILNLTSLILQSAASSARAPLLMLGGLRSDTSMILPRLGRRVSLS